MRWKLAIQTQYPINKKSQSFNRDYGSVSASDVQPSLKVKFPIILYKIHKRRSQLTLDIGKIRDYFQLSNATSNQLSQVFGIPKKSQNSATKIRKKPDYNALAIEYQRLIENGTCKARADIARHYGVSCAWVTKVMRHLR